MSALNRAKAAFDRAMFEPRSATALGIVRAVACGWLLVGLLFDVPAQFGLMPVELWRPTSIFRPLSLVGVTTLSLTTLRVLAGIWIASLVAGMVGLASRWVLPVATVLAFIVLGYMNNFGKIHHAYNLPIMAMVVLCCARCGDGFSVDRWLSGRDSDYSEEYGWPIFLIQFAFVALMCFGGLSKVFGRWVPPDPAMFEFLFARNIALSELKAVHLPRLSLWLANHAAVAMTMAYVALVLELCAPLALVKRGAARFVIIAGLLGMQLFNAFALGIHLNVPWLVGYAAFIDFDRVWAARPSAARAG